MYLRLAVAQVNTPSTWPQPCHRFNGSQVNERTPSPSQRISEYGTPNIQQPIELDLAKPPQHTRGRAMCLRRERDAYRERAARGHPHKIGSAEPFKRRLSRALGALPIRRGIHHGVQ